MGTTTSNMTTSSKWRASGMRTGSSSCKQPTNQHQNRFIKCGAHFFDVHLYHAHLYFLDCFEILSSELPKQDQRWYHWEPTCIHNEQLTMQRSMHKHPDLKAAVEELTVNPDQQALQACLNQLQRVDEWTGKYLRKPGRKAANERLDMRKAELAAIHANDADMKAKLEYEFSPKEVEDLFVVRDRVLAKAEKFVKGGPRRRVSRKATRVPHCVRTSGASYSFSTPGNVLPPTRDIYGVLYRF